MSVLIFLINVFATILLLSGLLMACSIQVVCNRDASGQGANKQASRKKLKILVNLFYPSHSDPHQQKALRKLALVMWGSFLVAVVLYFVALLNMNSTPG